MRDPLRDPFYRSLFREVGGSIVLGTAIVLVVIVGLSMLKPDVTLVADNSGTLTDDNPVRIRAPVTEDTPGPIINDKDVPDREINQTAPLSDRDR